MNVSTIVVSREEAAAKVQVYRKIPTYDRTEEDEALLRLYRAVLKGARVLNLHAAFRETGLNERGEPKLAIARADWDTCVFHPRHNIVAGMESSHRAGGGCFTEASRIDWRLRSNLVNIPRQTFADTQLTRQTLRTQVPHLPPNLRPKIDLRKFHILFEVEKWEEYPVDPFLLRHIAGALYVVEAEWELTPLEASLLSALTA